MMNRNEMRMEVKGLNVNHITGEIEVTKTFIKTAGDPFSLECEALVLTRSKFPTYTLAVKEIEKKDNKEAYSGLSIEKMLGAIKVINEAGVAEFERYIEIYTNEKTRKIEKGRYATIKKLFLNKYKAKYNALTDEEMALVDEHAKRIKVERANKQAEDLKRIREEAIKAEIEKRCNVIPFEQKAVGQN